jgi:tRNA(Ile)-lysidine synthase
VPGRRPPQHGPGALPPGLDRDRLVAEVARGLACLAEGARCVIGASGGADSTALAFLTDEARPDLEVTLVHVRHGMRDAEIDARDEATVALQASWLGRPLAVRAVEVVARGEGPEAAARTARHAALREVAAEVGARAILLAHHADDQAETLLLRLARGTGITGLSGMAPRAGDLVRPLLRVRGGDLRAFVAAEGLPHVDDPMNDDLDVRRVRVRREVLPALARIGPDPVGALVRLADLAREDAGLLDASAVIAAERDVAVHRVGRIVMVDSTSLRATHPSLSGRVAQALLVEMTGRPPQAVTVARVVDAPDGTAMTLPGPVDLRVEDGWHVLAPRPGAHHDPVALTREGRIVWSPARLVVALTRAPGRETSGLQLPLPFEPPTRLPPGVRRDRLLVRLAGADDLVVRHRRDGDRIGTAGGTRRLGEVLGELRVPRAVREVWPVVARSDTSAVVWVPGLVVDEDARRAGRDAPTHLVTVGPVVARH